MSTGIGRFRKFITSKTSIISNHTGGYDDERGGGGPQEAKPQVGFKVAYNEDAGDLKVRVIGARNLPKLYGNQKPDGYLIKVRMFPGRDKFETQLAKDAWPTFNEEFSFSVKRDLEARRSDQFTGKFVVLTAYALLNDTVSKPGKSVKGAKRSLQRLFSLNESQSERHQVELRRNSSTRRSSSGNRFSLSNRRTIGAVTYNLEAKSFSVRLKNGFYGTPDVWRDIQEISSGLEVESRESKKGSLEVTLIYSSSEDGNNDMFEVALSRLRCSMNTMIEHEKLKGSLYIKMTAMRLNDDNVISKWKSDRFEPTISLKIEAQSAILRAFFRSAELKEVFLRIRLMSKNVVGKKTLLGEIVIDGGTRMWKEAVANPSTAITRMIDLT